MNANLNNKANNPLDSEKTKKINEHYFVIFLLALYDSFCVIGKVLIEIIKIFIYLFLLPLRFF